MNDSEEVPEPSEATAPARTGVLRAGGEFRLIAWERLTAGQLITSINGVIRTRPSRYSVQIGVRLHMHPIIRPGLSASLDHCAWRFINHSCEPNTRIAQRQVRAMREVSAGEELTLDYAFTEVELAEPFDCRCESPHCRGRITGFCALTPAERKRAWPWAAPHLPIYGGASGLRPER